MLRTLACSFKTLQLSSLLRKPFMLFSNDTQPQKKRRYPDFDPIRHIKNSPKEEPFTMIPPDYRYDDDLLPLRMPEIKTRMLHVLSKYDQIALNDQFDWNAHFVRDHGLDSLDTIAIITSIEEEFHTVFEDSAFDNFKCFGDVADFISTLHDAF